MHCLRQVFVMQRRCMGPAGGKCDLFEFCISVAHLHADFGIRVDDMICAFERT